MHATRPSKLVTVGIVLATALATAFAMALGSLVVGSVEGSSAARARSSITTTWSTSKVKLGAPATVRGRVTSKRLQRRTVNLYVSLQSGWRLAASTRSDSVGRYTLKVPTDYYFSRPMRVRAPATTRARGVTSTSRTFTVTPVSAPAGSSGSWARAVAGQETRVNPCQVVTYRVNGATGTALADVQATMARVHEATGIRFRYLGTTAAVPKPSSLSTAAWPTDSTLVIAFVAPTATTFPLGGPAGYEIFSQSAILSTRAAHDAQGAVRRVTRAGVVLDATQDLGSGFQQLRGRILMHEVAATLGLGSVSSTSQRMSVVMPATVLPTAIGWGAGDLAGLGRVGLVEGCVTDN